MPIVRDANKPQHSLSDFHYGSLPVEGMPDGPADQLAFAFWDGTQWHMASLVGVAGIDVSYDPINHTVEIGRSDQKVSDTVTADGVILDTTSASTTADAVLQ